MLNRKLRQQPVTEFTKSKVRQLYQFLKQANQLRYTPIRNLESQEKFIRFAEMPSHPTLQIQRPIRVDEETQETPEFLVRVRRPLQTPCPTPPQPLQKWLLSGWDDPTKSVATAQSLNVVTEVIFKDDPQRVQDLGDFRDSRRLGDGSSINPPASISAWLKDGWDDEGSVPEVHERREITETVKFADDPERVTSYKGWLEQRSSWVEPELAARRAMAFYERIYDLYVTLEKDGENLELVVGDGRLQWRAISEGATREPVPVEIDHPILLKRVELRFSPEVPEFVIAETDREPELYSSIFVDLHDIMAAAIRNRSNELDQAGYHPLGWDDTTGFLRAFVQTISPTKGEYLESPPETGLGNSPRLYRDPTLILRKRSIGIANVVNAIIEDIEAKETFPSALEQITGTGTEWNAEDLGSGIESGTTTTNGTPSVPEATISDDEILLAKEANEEQLQIIRRLDKSGSVIVQGPPGTGKTHTIGNLIGHLLAQGKSILVTAQTAKALRVVRDKVPEMLRPLAVSVLGSDQNARGQLETAISSITERMTSDSAESLLGKAENFEAERQALLRQRKELGSKLRRALENEYRDINVGAKAFTPSEAARYVRENQADHGWIPAPIKIGASLTLNEQEISRLYSLGGHFSVQEELDAGRPIPEMTALPNDRQFSVMVTEYQGLVTADLSGGMDRWSTHEGGSEVLAKIAADLSQEFTDDLRKQAWRPYAIVAGIHAGSARAVWEKVIELIEEATEAQARHALVLHHQPKVSAAMPLPVQKKVVTEIIDYISGGGKLGFLQLMTRSEWKQFIKGSAVSAGEPSHKDHFEALAALVTLENARQSLQPLWDQLIGAHTNSPFASLGTNPEQACRALIPEIRRCLDWHDKTWKPLEERLRQQGLRLDDVLATIAREASQISDYQVIETLSVTVLPPLLTTEVARRKLQECEQGFAEIERLALSADQAGSDTGCIGRIVSALRARDPEAYSQAVAYAKQLLAIRPMVQERNALLTKLELVAPVWSSQIASRTPPHNQLTVPGDIQPAWTWRQLHDELTERDSLNANEIQLEIDKVDATLRDITLWLIDAKAWGKQLERLKQNNSIRQALVGWLDTMKVLISTRQKDRRQSLLSEARKLMKRCGEAVPVWVMPISIVAENFDPRSTRFDVVIIDEASQADLNALIPLYMGKQVIIVGDHEQVTPLGVGQGQVMLDNLRKQTLTDIPNSHLFDAKFSIYDIGRQSFGDGIRLVEHFRCVPEIIAFSNQLSYDGKIRPLRESNSTDIKPACVSIRVDGQRDKDVNRTEARKVIDLIKAMIAHPRYADKSIGVISMLGDQQTLLLQTLILKEIPGTEIEKRRIVAGNSSEFQGDERDIILLSMVDSPEGEGPMRTTGEGAFELIKKRYNVAASRARDQMFVVHSFDRDIHLRPGDLRLRLLQHVADPLASLRTYQQEVGKTESPFEKSVMKMLTDAGYKVRTQWHVGYYRIDMVVEGGGKRLAVECDGDRYHPIEKLADDIERQTILERLGWQFVRIRGSAFYRDAESAMRPVFERLRELEIPQEADTDLSDTTDMSLVHELEEMIAWGNLDTLSSEGCSQESSDSMVMTAIEDTIPVFMTSDKNQDDPEPGSPFGLLKSLGGMAQLEHFLREFAKSQGFQRLGKNVREKMMDELNTHVRKGHVVIDGKAVRIAKVRDN